jgi:hypothetical protein
MNETARVRTLLSEIEKSRTVLARIESFYDEYLDQTQDVSQATTEQAIVLSEILVNYYTCLETLFLRVSQFFENDLNPGKWHQDLLHKMSLHIEGIRDPVISDQTEALLSEFLRFRHFKRYYFEFEYDWDRIDFLRRKFDLLRPAIAGDLTRFSRFLQDLAG